MKVWKTRIGWALPTVTGNLGLGKEVKSIDSEGKRTPSML